MFDLDGFRGAAPYINAHRGHTFIVAFGGEAVSDKAFPALVHDIALLHTLGVRLVLVHGARPQIESRLEGMRIGSRYHEGLRVTDETALAAVKEAVGCVRVEIEALLSVGLVNTPMSGMRLRVASGNFVIARPLGVHDGVDYKFTGEVRRIDAEALHAQLDMGNIVLLPALGYSPTGETFNISSLDVATMTAASLRADKLIFLMEDTLRDGRRRALRQMSLPDLEALLQGRRKLDPNLRAYLEGVINACLAGVRRVHLLDRRVDGALLKEVYTRDGIGTLITAETYEGYRLATIRDVGGILELIGPLEQGGVLVRRSREQLELEIDRFSIIERDGMIIGCAALFAFTDEGMGELACLAIHPEYRNGGRGDTLLNHIENRAIKLGLERIFVLTTQTAHWFQERGFVRGDTDALPMGKQRLYNYQRKSKVFFKPLKQPD
ncbi:MAG: amino-acid N-acetyltransferase [Pseudomonadota bacterium]|nr:amino-acid N-acetyltransferase [Pseudomonadota bacterium]